MKILKYMGQASELGTRGLFSCPLLTRCSHLLSSFLNVKILIELIERNSENHTFVYLLCVFLGHFCC